MQAIRGEALVGSDGGRGAHHPGEGKVQTLPALQGTLPGIPRNISWHGGNIAFSVPCGLILFFFFLLFTWVRVSIQLCCGMMLLTCIFKRPRDCLG